MHSSDLFLAHQNGSELSINFTVESKEGDSCISGCMHVGKMTTLSALPSTAETSTCHSGPTICTTAHQVAVVRTDDQSRQGILKCGMNGGREAGHGCSEEYSDSSDDCVCIHVTSANINIETFGQCMSIVLS